MAKINFVRFKLAITGRKTRHKTPIMKPKLYEIVRMIGFISCDHLVRLEDVDLNLYPSVLQHLNTCPSSPRMTRSSLSAPIVTIKKNQIPPVRKRAITSRLFSCGT
jgi:hypothetical protein